MMNNSNKPNIAIAQINPIPADINYNKNKIIDFIKQAQTKNIDFLIFPQDVLYGYHNNDMLEKFPYIFKQINEALNEIKNETKSTVLIGYPSLFEGEIFNSFSLIFDNQIYENVKVFDCFDLNFEIVSREEIENPEFISEADCLIHSSMSLTKTNKEYFRNKMLSDFAKKQQKPLLFINQVGANDELIFDGCSRVYNSKGQITTLAKAFEEDLLEIDLDNNYEIQNKPIWFNKTTNLDNFSLNYENDLERTYKALKLAIKDYFSKNGFKQAVLGLSGGLDSTICAVLLADALGKENVLGVSMPSKLTSHESKNDGFELAKNLGIRFIEAPIKDYHDIFSKNFEGIFEKTENFWCNRYTNSFTQDNIQARSRAMILWGIANEFGSTLTIATSDKSESYMGYATINGDMSGGFAPIADITKTKLFALGKWMNENREIKNAIPENILIKPPGAELAIDPNTGKTLKAEDALMPYEFLDEVIWRIENLNQSIDNMMQSIFLYEKNNVLNKETKRAWLEKFFKRMNSAIYKWYILPPAPMVDSNSINKAQYNQPIVSNLNY